MPHRKLQSDRPDDASGNVTIQNDRDSSLPNQAQDQSSGELLGIRRLTMDAKARRGGTEVDREAGPKASQHRARQQHERRPSHRHPLKPTQTSVRFARVRRSCPAILTGDEACDCGLSHLAPLCGLGSGSGFGQRARRSVKSNPAVRVIQHVAKGLLFRSAEGTKPRPLLIAARRTRDQRNPARTLL